jgi:hypothetical protein
VAVDELEFRARQRHPYFYIGTTFGLILVATGVAALAAGATSMTNDIVGLFALGFGGAILISAAYVVRGRLRISAGDDGWLTVTWTLGRWSRSKRFPRADVRSARRYTPSAFAIMWPSIAGIQLRIDIQRERRPLDVGGGMELDELSLRAIEALLAAGPPK